MRRFAIVLSIVTATFGTSAFAAAKCKEQTAGLSKKASVTCEQAQKAAEKKVPDGKIIESELEEENGKLVYSFDMKRKGQSGVEEVQVDASSGQIASAEHENAKAERKEKQQEQKGSGK